MLDSLLKESRGIVCFVIESDNHFNAHFLEDGYVICRGKNAILLMKKILLHICRYCYHMVN